MPGDLSGSPLVCLENPQIVAMDASVIDVFDCQPDCQPFMVLSGCF